MDIEPNLNKVIQPTNKDKNYEALMAELAQVMKTMENTETSLEDQLKNYEKGMRLVSELEALLKGAEERITIINKAGQEERFE